MQTDERNLLFLSLISVTHFKKGLLHCSDTTNIVHEGIKSMESEVVRTA